MGEINTAVGFRKVRDLVFFGLDGKCVKVGDRNPIVRFAECVMFSLEGLKGLILPVWTRVRQMMIHQS